MLHHKLP